MVTRIVYTGNKPGRKKIVPFSKLKEGECFRLVTGTAIYRKVRLRHSSEEPLHRMMELTTGDVFIPSNADCEVIDVTIHIRTKR